MCPRSVEPFSVHPDPGLNDRFGPALGCNRELRAVILHLKAPALSWVRLALKKESMDDKDVDTDEKYIMSKSVIFV